MSESYSVIYSPEAINDLREIYSYIAFELMVPSTAEGQVNRIRKTIRSLGFMPSRNPIVDWEPWKNFTLSFPFSVHISLPGSFEKTVCECLYLEYLGTNLENRAEELFCMIHNFQCYSVRLEDILQTGSHKLPEFEQFLPRWIEYLGSHSGMGIKSLLEEAQSMLQDEQQVLDMARKFFSGTENLMP